MQVPFAQQAQDSYPIQTYARDLRAAKSRLFAIRASLDLQNRTGPDAEVLHALYEEENRVLREIEVLQPMVDELVAAAYEELEKQRTAIKGEYKRIAA